MPQFPLMRTLWSLLLAAGLAVAGSFAAESPEPARFSQSVAAEERISTGFHRLNSDQVAVLDVMVRRDTAARSQVRADPDAPALFSQRLTPDERRLSGITLLSPAELPLLDAAVARFTNASLSRTLLAPPVYISRTARVEPAETKKEREIHGSYSLSYGWGKGGYSEKSGSMLLTLEDPAHRYSISVGYTETHIKGPDGWRYFEGPPLRP